MKIIPYLYFNGNAEEALNTYKDIFNGEIPVLQRYSDGPAGMPVPDNYDDKVMHGRLVFGDVMIYVSDFDRVTGNSPHALSVEFDDVETLEHTYAKMLDHAEPVFKLQDTFWGAKYAKVTDKFGINWDFNFQHPHSDS